MKKILLRAAALLLALVLAGCGTASPAETVPTEADKTDDNYRVFYEIFVGSFADSDGDGTGDLNGILRHLDYLNDGNLLSDTSLGVQGLWLTPIFASPSYHNTTQRITTGSTRTSAPRTISGRFSTPAMPGM